MKIVLAEPSGACYGVERALQLARDAVYSGDYSAVYTLGPLIHNPIVVGSLEARGVKAVESVSDVDDGCLVIRSHGVTKQVMDQAKRKGLPLIDATCPHVSRVQQETARLAKDGRFVVIIGEHGHPEVEGIESYSGENHAVVQSPSEIPELAPNTRIGVVVQTTQSQRRLNELVDWLSLHFDDIEVSNTICSATQKRQLAARQTAREADVMIVIGGRNSGNTRRLYELCCAECPNTYHIESASELQPDWFMNCETVAVTAGASTPQSQIDEVLRKLEEISGDDSTR